MGGGNQLNWRRGFFDFSFSYFEIFWSQVDLFRVSFYFSDAEMTIFVPVDEIEHRADVLELFYKASNVSASPEDREKFANLLKG